MNRNPFIFLTDAALEEISATFYACTVGQVPFADRANVLTSLFDEDYTPNDGKQAVVDLFAEAVRRASMEQSIIDKLTPNNAVVDVLAPPTTNMKVDAASLMAALRNGISDDELQTLAMENFPIVYNRFGLAQSAEQKRRELVQWCLKQGYARKLVLAIVTINPNAFEVSNG